MAPLTTGQVDDRHHGRSIRRIRCEGQSGGDNYRGKPLTNRWVTRNQPFGSVEIAHRGEATAFRRGELGGMAENGGAKGVVAEFAGIVVGDAAEGAGGQWIVQALEGETASEDRDAGAVAE